MKKIILYIGFFLVLGELTSCSSDFLKEYSQSLGRVQTADDLNELLMGDCTLPLGTYTTDAAIQNPNYMMVHFLGDELEENKPDYEPYNESFHEDIFPYYTWQQNVYQDNKGKNSLINAEDTYWSLGYEKINNCNMVIDAADNLNVVSDEDVAKVKRVKGEAYFFRASYYLMLCNLYGKPYAPSTAATELAVPLKISPNVEDKEYTRASVADIYAQIVSDLGVAESLLADASEASIYHANLEAVYILRSRVALYMQDWQTAADYARKAINRNGYLQNLASLATTDYPMSKNNGEIVFSNGSSCLGNVCLCRPNSTSTYSGNAASWIISDHLLGLFDKNDYRLNSYISFTDDVISHQPVYHKIDNAYADRGKYKDVSDVFSIRTAEAYLNLAEADVELGQEDEACKELNELRRYRVKGVQPIQLTGSELMTFVREERERELFLEGHRWFDLRRYSVDEKYPFSKEIIHSMTYWNGKSPYTKIKTDLYKLDKNDGAYVFDIPYKVKAFQPSIGANSRPARLVFKSNGYEDAGDDDEEDY